VTVEVDRDLAALTAWLGRAGVPVRSEGRLVHVDVSDDNAYDLVRDGVAELGLGLVRMERERHRMTEIFTGAPAGAPTGAPAGAPEPQGGVRG
jgi:ABC-2 type transport system ATP-binding protein